MEFPDKTAGAPAPPPKQKAMQVVTGAKLVKRPASKRFKDFIMAESPRVLMERIGRDVLWPRAKAAVEEAGNSFLSGMLWGDGAGRPSSQIVRGTVLRGAVNYNGISQQTPMAQALQVSHHRSSGNYQDIVCPTQQEAERVLANLYALLQHYNVVNVASLYESVGIEPAISDEIYGWTSLDGARISHSREGFTLELPRPVII